MAFFQHFASRIKLIKDIGIKGKLMVHSRLQAAQHVHVRILHGSHLQRVGIGSVLSLDEHAPLLRLIGTNVRRRQEGVIV